MDIDIENPCWILLKDTRGVISSSSYYYRLYSNLLSVLFHYEIRSIVLPGKKQLFLDQIGMQVQFP